jgi:hypothetical protein
LSFTSASVSPAASIVRNAEMYAFSSASAGEFPDPSPIIFENYCK